MLHEIAPHVLDHAYQYEKLQSKDRLICFRDGQILLVAVSEDEWHLPTVDSVLDQRAKGEASLRFLFHLDQESCYLCSEQMIKENENCFWKEIHSFRTENRITKEERFAIYTGWHLYCWYRDNRFCGRCGGELVHAEQERMLYCKPCGRELFPTIAPAVIIALTDGDRILLSKYAGRKYTGYALLAGFTEIGETPEQTVAREVMEEVGLRVKNITYYRSQPGGIDCNLLLGFYCELDGTDQIHMDQQELSMAAWYHRDEIPVEDNGFSLTFEMIGRFKHHPELFPAGSPSGK